MFVLAKPLTSQPQLGLHLQAYTSSRTDKMSSHNQNQDKAASPIITESPPLQEPMSVKAPDAPPISERSSDEDSSCDTSSRVPCHTPAKRQPSTYLTFPAMGQWSVNLPGPPVQRQPAASETMALLQQPQQSVRESSARNHTSGTSCLDCGDTSECPHCAF